jgi:hypothetical protein
MTHWDGKERRSNMNDDTREILIELRNDMKHVREWTKGHDVKDDMRFAEVNKKLIWGGVALVIIASASGVLGQVLQYLN